MAEELLTDEVRNISITGESLSLFDANVDSTEFVTVESRKGDLGRVVVAIQNIKVGTKILRETPALVFWSREAVG